ncbi:hypothetical protein J437_LFUL005448 [Ladona fulva]|uniref:DUF4485 domain-containing protein n=1 Tax=Ladona fulva TaxID=123851 RepID=A0A8K0JY63_LADFU|nr:hypothetical protein J437_LFUL005448 [Ladona fulva]
MQDSYDIEFNQCLSRAEEIITKMEDKENQKICAKWIERLLKLQSNDLEVKRNRNEFFKFLIQTLEEGTSGETFLPTADFGTLPLQDKDEDPIILSHWSDDRRTYTSIKTLPNSGAIIYMAVSSDPEAGWEIPNPY